jgi:hypothetical protein
MLKAPMSGIKPENSPSAQLREWITMKKSSLSTKKNKILSTIEAKKD